MATRQGRVAAVNSGSGAARSGAHRMARVRVMFLRRFVVCATTGLLVAMLLIGPATAADQEGGQLSCALGRVVWITERTSAGTTTVSFNGSTRKFLKRAWSTTKTRTGLRSTWWRVATTGQMDHKVTGASCGL
jgi:hypothetical protein